MVDEFSAVVLLGNILIAAGFCIVFVVYRQNHFTSATIEIVEGQKVVAKGMYAFLRHPMYMGTLLMLLGTPFSLGSYWSLLAVPPILTSLIWRLVDEEQLLARSLPGYCDYLKKVRYRLIPGVY
jgi:protein-S-isoprenylcysteine O-methyltransferase Ste14